jgi:Protein of unknown function (DUF1549)/Protein of unknown function (DUF1553)/Planctomycete cytochrome C
MAPKNALLRNYWHIVISFIMLGLTYCATGQEPVAGSIEYFNTKVEPLLKAACYECHSHTSGESSGKLMVDSLQALIDGGTRGPAIVAGKPLDSLLVKAISYADTDLQMPPAGALPDEQQQILKVWIAAGAIAPRSANTLSKPQKLSEDIAKSHWAYQIPKASTRAIDLDGTSPHQAIDAIVVAKLAENGLKLSAAADRATLLRRLHYDLTGLPATFVAIEEFVRDPRSDQEVIDAKINQLLASPQFGERWARHWMDVARYADTKGYVFQEDRQYPEAYRYRDWLIDAFNSDMPYGDFIRKQLAADLEPREPEKDLPALGFLTLGRRFLNNKHDIIDDRLDVVSRGLMGMTLACSRCHDHKYDPISQADYYGLYGVFLNTDEPGGVPFAHRLTDTAENRKSHILLRGSPGNRGDEVERRFVKFLSSSPDKLSETGSGRTQLAARIVDAQNPLTARVFVNRVWMRMMGTSITESPSDFGTRCPPPQLQELLDQMAVDFIKYGWSVKQLIRSIAQSRVYQQQSLNREDAVKVDPANGLYWRANRRRRDFESLRDSLLAVANQLDLTLYGKAEKIHERPFSRRRTLYAHLDRQNLPSMFRSFDMASPDSHSPVRPYTSVPQQGLYLLNSDFVCELALDLGAQAQARAGSDQTAAAISELVAKTLGRLPTSDELVSFSNYISVDAVQTPAFSERWICGYGEFDATAQKINSFNRLPTFTGDTWRGEQGPPDPRLGWCLLNREGGHPGMNPSAAAIRRWIAPRTGKLKITGTLKHESDQGDGVRASIVVNEHVGIGQWTASKNQAKTDPDLMLVQAGHKIDFVTDCIGNQDNDGFKWRIRLKYLDGAEEAFDSNKELPEPINSPLNSWQQLAQALLASNEFAFVD